jgi:Fur family iron response transcriptional regulator
MSEMKNTGASMFRVNQKYFGGAKVLPSNQESHVLLERYGLRATRQRLGLAKLLFSKGDRHVTADALAAEAQEVRISASLATVYNVLNLFAQVGLVRGLAIEGTKTIFDTNTSDHCHFYFEETGDIDDIVVEGMTFANAFEAPEGYEIVKVDVVVRLRKKG